MLVKQIKKDIITKVKKCEKVYKTVPHYKSSADREIMDKFTYSHETTTATKNLIY